MCVSFPFCLLIPSLYETLHPSFHFLFLSSPPPLPQILFTCFLQRLLPILSDKLIVFCFVLFFSEVKLLPNIPKRCSDHSFWENGYEWGITEYLPSLPLIFRYYLGNTFYSTKTMQVVYHCKVMFGVGNFRIEQKLKSVMEDGLK